MTEHHAHATAPGVAAFETSYAALLAEGHRVRISGWPGGDVVLMVTSVGEHGELTVEQVPDDE